MSNENNRKNNRFISFFANLNIGWQMIGLCLLFLLIGEATLHLGYTIKEQIAPSIIDKRVASPVYDTFPDKNAFWKEHIASWDIQFEPYFHWRRKPFQGQYTNIDQNGIRHTPKSPNTNAKKVFLFGGSTMWGWGTPDHQTIPAYLQQQLGPDYDVTNMGETGYVAAQELNFLMYQLAQGNIPDIVIFYDGVNEGYGGVYSPGIPRDPNKIRFDENKEKQLKELPFALRIFIQWKDHLMNHSSYKHLVTFLRNTRDRLTSIKGNHAKWETNISDTIPDKASTTLAFYEQHIKQVNALAKEYGFKAFFFWQPNLLSLTKPRTAFEEFMFQTDRSPVFVKAHQTVYQLTKEKFSGRQDENIYFLGNIFDDTHQEIYIDWCHLGPEGNSMVAQHIYTAIKEKISN